MSDYGGAPLAELLPEVYQRLYDTYGPQGWWPGDSPFEVIVGAILTQSTAWTNVEKALAAMKTAGCWSFEAIAALPELELAAIIRSFRLLQCQGPQVASLCRSCTFPRRSGEAFCSRRGIAPARTVVNPRHRGGNSGRHHRLRCLYAIFRY